MIFETSTKTTQQEFIQNYIDHYRTTGEVNTGELSDGHHTFGELYYHRMILFVVICHTFKDVAYKSKLHADGTMYEDYFIVGITTPQGEYFYHYHLEHWNKFQIKELERALEYDGHKPSDIGRLFSLIKPED